MHSMTSDEVQMSISLRVRHIALGGGTSVSPAPAARKAGHGNDSVWRNWKAMTPASQVLHTLWKSLRDSHIPTASTTGYMSSRAPQLEPSPLQGACNDVSSPQRNACPG